MQALDALKASITSDHDGMRPVKLCSVAFLVDGAHGTSSSIQLIRALATKDATARGGAAGRVNRERRTTGEETAPGIYETETTPYDLNSTLEVRSLSMAFSSPPPIWNPGSGS